MPRKWWGMFDGVVMVMVMVDGGDATHGQLMVGKA
jgi:hypothetical protein